MLTRIQIRGFKSIREMDLELRQINILIGANGSGKSNFISVFQLLNAIIEKRLRLFVGKQGANRLLYYGNRITQNIEIDLSFKNNAYKFNLAYAPSGQRLIFEYEIISYHDKKRYEIPWSRNLGAGHEETLLFKESAAANHLKVSDYVIKNIKGWKLYHFHDTSDLSPIKQDVEINDNIMLDPDAGNLASYLYFLKKRQYPYYKLIRKAVCQIAPFFDDFVLEPLELSPSKIRLRWKERESEDIFDVNYLSDGTLRYICLATLLLQPNLPSVILIDEPELGLHPSALMLLASLIQIASEKTQLIISTQSQALLNHFEPEDILVVDRVDKQSTFRRLSADDLLVWLDEYSLSELWEKNVFGGKPQYE